MKKKDTQFDPLKPSAEILAALGSLIVHYEETLSPSGRELDQYVIDQTRNRVDVKQWFNAMDKLALLPLKRDHRTRKRGKQRNNDY